MAEAPTKPNCRRRRWLDSKFDKTKNQWTEPVTMILSEIGGNKGAESPGFRVGNMVAAYGNCVPDTNGGMSVWYAELLPPGVKWETSLQTPDAISAGQTQTYTVNCVVKNTGA